MLCHPHIPTRSYSRPHGSYSCRRLRSAGSTEVLTDAPFVQSQQPHGLSASSPIQPQAPSRRYLQLNPPGVTFFYTYDIDDPSRAKSSLLRFIHPFADLTELLQGMWENC